jgi:DNA-binding NarL/FixJ family response regulator
MRLIIVDDDERFVLALEALLETLPDVEVVGHALDGDAGVALAARLRPDVVIMDLEMPRLTGLEATRRIRDESPESAVVMLSGSDVEAHSGDAHAAGAVAYVRKTTTVTDLPKVLDELRARRSA